MNGRCKVYDRASGRWAWYVPTAGGDGGLLYPCVGEPVSLVIELALEAVVEDWDGSVKPIEELT